MLKYLLMGLCAFGFYANAQSIYQEEMQRIDISSQTPYTLNMYSGSPLLTSFFMPNCRWCQRQHKVLKKLQKICPTLQTVMLGVQGSKQKLKMELKREHNSFPAYIASRNIINAIGTKSPVPMMLIFNAKGKLVFKTQGYTPKDKLINLLNKYEIPSCNI
ncbi:MULTISPECIES: thioredoxin family protein [unclassified Pseudoalteromonas]|uniref:thioredoxin family protein n=1 Tax=unclassified Pseudoalteromonas TaxID=194690 RepID=UPI00069349CF|nr:MULTISPECIES: thioredoxin family protein [unclassified Pseudoalteromonas]